jgi:hypothetical protein
VIENEVINHGMLFFEWMFRQERNHVCPLKDHWIQNDLARFSNINATKPLHERFLEFSRALDQLDSPHDFFRSDDHNCLAMTFFRRSVEFKRIFGSKRLAKIEPSQNVSKTSANFAPSISEVKKEGARVDGIQLQSRMQNPQMRRLALEELERIRGDKQSRAYADLQMAFYDSLDEDSRVLILDVKKQMQSSQFDDHLKPRLVRFMVENPGAWSSFAATPAKG